MPDPFPTDTAFLEHAYQSVLGRNRIRRRSRSGWSRSIQARLAKR